MVDQFDNKLLVVIPTDLIIIILYIYHALIDALSAHVIHINLNILYTCRAQSYKKKEKKKEGKKRECKQINSW